MQAGNRNNPSLAADCPDWPEAFRDRYIAAGYWKNETLGGMLRQQARRMPDRIALVQGARRTSYAELDRRVDSLCAGLLSLGISPGDRVVLQLPNGIAFVEMSFALFRIGALPVFALPAHRALEIGRFCEFTQATAYIVADTDENGFDYRTLARQVQTQAPSLRHVIVDGDAQGFQTLESLYRPPVLTLGPGYLDVACLQLSGGTSGVPKLIPRRHTEYLYFARQSAAICQMGQDDVYLSTLPMAHNMPMAGPGFIGTLAVGGKVVMADAPSPDDCFPLIEREGVTVTALVPPLALLWMEAAQDSGHDLSSLRLLEVGGAKFNPAGARRVSESLGCTLLQGFGFTEGQAYMTRPGDPEAVIVGTQGRPISPGDEFRIVDEDDRDVAPGQIGQLLARGPYTVRGYYRMPDLNRSAFTADGYYRSGDLVRLADNGNIVVEGRSKEQINKGGEKFSAEEIEDVCIGHPDVLDAAIVSVPDALMGERTSAFVLRRRDSVTGEELKGFLRSRGLAAYKIPDRIEFIRAFPETGVGKVSRRVLRDTLRSRLVRG